MTASQFEIHFDLVTPNHFCECFYYHDPTYTQNFVHLPPNVVKWSCNIIKSNELHNIQKRSLENQNK